MEQDQRLPQFKWSCNVQCFQFDECTGQYLMCHFIVSYVLIQTQSAQTLPRSVIYLFGCSPIAHCFDRSVLLTKCQLQIKHQNSIVTFKKRVIQTKNPVQRRFGSAFVVCCTNDINALFERVWSSLDVGRDGFLMARYHCIAVSTLFKLAFLVKQVGKVVPVLRGNIGTQQMLQVKKQTILFSQRKGRIGVPTEQ